MKFYPPSQFKEFLNRERKFREIRQSTTQIQSKEAKRRTPRPEKYRKNPKTRSKINRLPIYHKSTLQERELEYLLHPEDPNKERCIYDPHLEDRGPSICNILETYYEKSKYFDVTSFRKRRPVLEYLEEFKQNMNNNNSNTTNTNNIKNNMSEWDNLVNIQREYSREEKIPARENKLSTREDKLSAREDKLSARGDKIPTIRPKTCNLQEYIHKTQNISENNNINHINPQQPKRQKKGCFSIKKIPLLNTNDYLRSNSHNNLSQRHKSSLTTLNPPSFTARTHNIYTKTPKPGSPSPSKTPNPQSISPLGISDVYLTLHKQNKSNYKLEREDRKSARSSGRLSRNTMRDSGSHRIIGDMDILRFNNNNIYSNNINNINNINTATPLDTNMLKSKQIKLWVRNKLSNKSLKLKRGNNMSGRAPPPTHPISPPRTSDFAIQIGTSPWNSNRGDDGWEDIKLFDKYEFLQPGFPLFENYNSPFGVGGARGMQAIYSASGKIRKNKTLT